MSYGEIWIYGVATGRYGYRLASPFGLGDEWYALTREYILLDFERKVSLAAWLWDWERFKVFHHGEGFQEAVDEFLWGMWGDGMRMLGL